MPNVSSNRRGVAIGELAICLPVVLLISISLIELASLIFLKQSLAVAAYEGAHRGVQPAATSKDVIATANEILRDRQVQGARVSVTPGNILTLRAGDLFTVRVTAPSDRNAIAIFRLFQPTTLVSEVVCMKESNEVQN